MRRIKLLVSQNSVPFGGVKTVCCIGTCFYAANQVNVPTNPQTASVRGAKVKFKARLEHIMALCKTIEGAVLAEAGERGKNKRGRRRYHFLGISNITYQLAICEILGDEVEMRFCSDVWEIDKVKFRTT